MKNNYLQRRSQNRPLSDSFKPLCSLTLRLISKKGLSLFDQRPFLSNRKKIFLFQKNGQLPIMASQRLDATKFEGVPFVYNKTSSFSFCIRNERCQMFKKTKCRMKSIKFFSGININNFFVVYRTKKKNSPLFIKKDGPHLFLSFKTFQIQKAPDDHLLNSFSLSALKKESTQPKRIPKKEKVISQTKKTKKLNNLSELTKTSLQTKSKKTEIPLINNESSLTKNTQSFQNDLNQQFNTTLIKQKRLITISLAPPQLIRQWAETKLPNGKVVGQVMNANTLHYSTLLPMKGGLFCERIFGPIKDFQCACGIQKGKPISLNPSLLQKNESTSSSSSFHKNSSGRLFCPKCDVEYTWSDKRRNQQGYIQLASPVTHIWYLKANPSIISILLGMKKSHAEAITYCTHILTLDVSLQTGRYIDSPDQLKQFLNLNKQKKNSLISNTTYKNKIAFKPTHRNWWRQKDKVKWRNDLLSSLLNKKRKEKNNLIQSFLNDEMKFESLFSVHISSNLKIKNKLFQRNSNNRDKNFFKTSFYKMKIIHLIKSEKSSSYNLPILLKGSNNPFLKEYKRKNTSFSFVKNFLTNEKNLTKMKRPILFNNIYSLSHRYHWTSDIKVQKLLSYMWSNNDLRAIPMYNYKHRIVTGIFSEQYAIAGGGILAQLLAECNPQEYHNIIYQLEARIPNLIQELRDTKTKKEKKEYRDLLKIALLRIQFYKTAFLPKSQDILDFLSKKSTKDKELNKTKFTLNRNTEFEKEKLLFQKDGEKTGLFFPPPLFEKMKTNKKSLVTQNPNIYSYSSSLLNEETQKQRLNNNNLKITSTFRNEWMFISVLPVLPPALRPIIQMQDQIISTDLNRLYQKIIYRNDRVKKFMRDFATSNSSPMLFAQKLLQESVDNLIENGKGGTKPETDKKGRPLKSLGDLLKGKQGRFRQNLLGKRVDYSGRSVIVVGPRLKLFECGLPKEMALVLFKPFLIKQFIQNGVAKTIVGAKKCIKTDPVLTSSYLNNVLEQHVVLLNRAPTLHRVGFQAFRPKLVEGRAILLHPLVCPAFNADFDGDQMAVHVPLTFEARTEAWKFMLSPNNILSPATGEPLAQPSQDMVLGCYYLTTLLNKHKINNDQIYFRNFDQVLNAYQKNFISLHTNVWVKYDGLLQMDTKENSHSIIEMRIYSTGQNSNIHSKLAIVLDSDQKKISQMVLTTPGRILFHFLIHKKV
jgi:DNA-directed RNA polymerase beta' subunit